jgi:hypothetical protein
MIQSHKSYSKVSGMLALAAGVLLGTAALYSDDASACGFTNWQTVSAGNPYGTGFTACDPNSDCPRYQGQCSYESVAETANFVVHGGGADGTLAGTADDIWLRFYAFFSTSNPLNAANSLALNGGSLSVFQALDDADGTPNSGNETLIAEIVIEEGTTSPFQAVLRASVGGTVQAIGNPVQLANGWHTFTVKRTITPAQISLTVDNNASPPTGAVDTTTVDRFRFGSIAKTGSPTGKTYFDSVVTNRTTLPPELLACDADASGAVNVSDVLAAGNEIFGLGLANGTVDCISDGVVNVSDILQMGNVIFNP